MTTQYKYAKQREKVSFRHKHTHIYLFIISYFIQVLHVIDDILTPLMVNPSSSADLNNPDGFQFLTYADSLEIGGYRIRLVLCLLHFAPSPHIIHIYLFKPDWKM